MAGPVDAYSQLIPQFCRQLGVGFQILNDLKDWNGDLNNKLVPGQDALALRPTLLLALALQSASPEQRQQLREFYESVEDGPLRLARLRQMYQSLGVFEKAQALVDKSRDRAESLADDVQSDALRQLLYFLVDTVLAEEEPPPPVEHDSLVQLPIVAGV
jgi:geranylgeranyl pyrophosphate synthase